MMSSTSSTSSNLGKIGGPVSTPPGTPQSLASSSRRLDSGGLKSLSELVQSAVHRGMHRKSSSLSSHHGALNSLTSKEETGNYKSRLVLFSQWLSSSLESGQCPSYSEVERRLHQVNVLSVDSVREL